MWIQKQNKTKNSVSVVSSFTVYPLLVYVQLLVLHSRRSPHQQIINRKYILHMRSDFFVRFSIWMCANSVNIEISIDFEKNAETCCSICLFLSFISINKRERERRKRSHKHLCCDPVCVCVWVANIHWFYGIFRACYTLVACSCLLYAFLFWSLSVSLFVTNSIACPLINYHKNHCA